MARSLDLLWVIGSLTFLHFLTGGTNAQNVSVDIACGKDNDQQNLFKKK